MAEAVGKSALQVGKIRLDLENLHHYANFTEKSLKAEMEEIDAFVRKHGREDSVDEELWNVTEVFPHLHRSSVLLSVFAFFEHNLNAVCDSLAQEHGKRLRVVDLSGRGLERAKTYMSKEIGITFPAASESWQELVQLHSLRNVIAHRDGLLKPEDKALKDYVSDSAYLSVDHDGRVRLHEGILKHLLDHLESFFKDLGAAVCA